MKGDGFELDIKSLPDYLRAFLDPITKTVILIGLLFIGLYSTNLLILACTTVVVFVIFTSSYKSIRGIIRVLLVGTTITLISIGLLLITTDLNRPCLAFIVITSRFLITIFSVEWFFAAVSPYELVYMLERIRFPVTLSWMIMLIYQQVPLLTKEFHRINEARKLRGLTARIWQLKKLTKLIKTLLNPLISSTVNQSVDFAQAMILRGFTFKRQKERFINFKLQLQDFLLTIFTLGFVVIVIIIRINHFLKAFEWY